MTRTTVRGKSRQPCPKCRCSILRVVWERENNQTVRRFVCPTLGCPYTSEAQPMDRLVRSLIAPHDAAFLHRVLAVAQKVCDHAVQPGEEEMTRYLITELQQRINQLPPDLVAKIEKEGA